MNILVIDCTSEQQAMCANKILAIPQQQQERLGLRVNLAPENGYESRLAGVDIVVLGGGLEERVFGIARSIRAKHPTLNIIMFVSDSFYSDVIFKGAQQIGVRRVFSMHASPLDVLQELLSIHSSFCLAGRAQEGKVILAMGVKGGVGVTSLCAALGEACSNAGRRTLLWDLDGVGSDLSRALLSFGQQGHIVSQWVADPRHLNRESFEDALVPVSPNAHLLMPPATWGDFEHMRCTVEGSRMLQRVLDLARPRFDSIIIDGSALCGVARRDLLRFVDRIFVVAGGGALGCSGTGQYLSHLAELVDDPHRVSVVCMGDTVHPRELEKTVGFAAAFASWDMPAIPQDDRGQAWVGQSKTLFSSGNPATKRAIGQIVERVGLSTRKLEIEVTRTPFLHKLRGLISPRRRGRDEEIKALPGVDPVASV
jgi:Mrp family chromosome partitioning ATPase